MKVGDTYQLSFELPVSHVVVDCEVKAIKTYDNWSPQGTQDSVGHRLAEMHFVILSGERKKSD